MVRYGVTYHHGNLRESLLEAAADVLAEEGPATFSLRSLARQIGVSHTAPRHHFGDKRGVFTAVAAEGYRLLSGRLDEAGDDFLAAGVAYVAFALDKPGHFSVMFQPELIDATDKELVGAQNKVGRSLAVGAASHAQRTGRPLPSQGGGLPPYALLAWSAAHGIAHLALGGSLTAMGHGAGREELLNAAREALRLLDPAAD